VRHPRVMRDALQERFPAVQARTALCACACQVQGLVLLFYWVDEIFATALGVFDWFGRLVCWKWDGVCLISWFSGVLVYYDDKLVIYSILDFLVSGSLFEDLVISLFGGRAAEWSETW
jgi:hypothetical protein